MMRLGIDVREIEQGVYTGIGRPLFNFINYLSRQENEDTFVLFSTQKIPFDFGPRFNVVVLKQWNTFIWDQWQLPRAIKSAKVDCFYSPYYKFPLLKPVPCVSAILDLMYLTYPPYYKQMSYFAKAYYATFGKAFARRADKIWTCSEFSRRDIERTYGIKALSIEVIPLTLGPNYAPQVSAISKHGRYILYMGNFKPHKNVVKIIEAFALISNTFTDLNLVLAGPKEHTYLELAALAHQLNVHHRVVFPGAILEKDRPQDLYSNAEAFVMPSLYEGFGLPPLEAMACGVPVVASNTTSIPEVVADAGLLVNPTSAHDIAQGITRILTDPTLREDLTKKGLARAKAFRDDGSHQRLYQILKQVSL